MQYTQFFNHIIDATKLERETVGRLVDAFYETLGERLPATEVKDLSSQLPDELGRVMTRAETLVKYDAEEFLETVAERAGESADDTRLVIAAAWTAMEEFVSGGELDDVLDALPTTFSALFMASEEGVAL